MPLVNVKLAAGAFTEKQKHDMAARLTDVMVAFEGSEAFREVVWCSSRKSSATAGTSAVSRSSARISDQAWQASFNVAVAASAHAAYACVDTWLTDFRADLPKIDVPTLLIHGDADRVLPYAATAARLPGLKGPDVRHRRRRPAQRRLDPPRGRQRCPARLPRPMNGVRPLR